jgi:RNA polymerase sigma factor (sigma-70 family)
LTLRDSACKDADEKFRRGLLDLIPFLRAFSRSLCGDRELADDLAQEALTKAWQSRDTFRAGSNLKAWLFTILRNQFYSDRRRAWRQAPWDETAAERAPSRAARKCGRWSFPIRRAPCTGFRMSNVRPSFWSVQAAFRMRTPRGFAIARSAPSKAALHVRAKR